MFHDFTENHAEMKKFRNYRLLAVDGSVLNIAPSDTDDGTYIPQVAGSGYYALHLNAMYDILNRIYVDAIVQPGKENGEKRAMADMIDRSDIGDMVIVTADRGYESSNIFAHAGQKGWNYLIRVKDLESTGILSSLSLPDFDEFDVQANRILTRKQTNAVKANPDIYRYIASTTVFDYLPKHTRKHRGEFYPLSFRVVRFKVLDNLYETVITNLDSTAFSPDDLKELYIMRWGIETSFRKLKYTIGLTCFHSKKRDFIKQEIFARLIMYNFAEMVTSRVIISQSDRKLLYQVNFTVAVHVRKRFLRPSKNEIPINIEALIRKHILPIRPGRKDKRSLRSKSVVSFLYRVA